MLTTPIYPKGYGKGYDFLRKICYLGYRPLNDRKYYVTKPMNHTKNKDTTSLGYAIDDNPPIYDKEPSTTSDLEDVI